MKRLYWSGKAVIDLFLGRHSAFLLRPIELGFTVHTGAATRTEFQIAVAQASMGRSLKRGGAEMLREAFEEAVSDGKLILIEALAAPGDALFSVREHIQTLDANTAAHLALAKQRNFSHFVCTDETVVPLCKAWNLRPMTPATAPKLRCERGQPDVPAARPGFCEANHLLSTAVASDPLLKRATDIINCMVSLCEKLQLLRPSEDPQSEEGDPISDFFSTVDEIDTLLFEADDELTRWQAVHSKADEIKS